MKLRGRGVPPLPKPQDSTSDLQWNKSCAPHRHSGAGRHRQMLYFQLLLPASLKSHHVAFSLVKALRNTGERPVRDYTSDYITPLIYHLPCSAVLAVQCANASAQGSLNHLALLEVLWILSFKFLLGVWLTLLKRILLLTKSSELPEHTVSATCLWALYFIHSLNRCLLFHLLCDKHLGPGDRYFGKQCIPGSMTNGA